MDEADFQWTQDSWDRETEVRERRVSARNSKLAWFGVIALAVLAFEVTADPGLTVALGCLKFGWDEFRLARWLKRADPDRRRGRVCAWFYLAWGLWRISLVAIATAFILALVMLLLEKQLGRVPGAAGPPPGFAGALMLSLCGFFFCSAVSSIAVVLALRNSIKIWVGPEVRWAKERNCWPPQDAAEGRYTSNRTKVILLSGLITIVVVGFFVVFLPLSFFLFPARGAQNKNSDQIILMFTLIFLTGVPMAILMLLEKLGNRMIAASPWDCWVRLTDSDQL